MSLHGKPQCAASRMALHLEQTYGLQLDPYRHRQLIAELEEFTGRVDDAERLLIAAEGSTDEPEPSDPATPDTSDEYGHMKTEGPDAA